MIKDFYSLKRMKILKLNLLGCLNKLKVKFLILPLKKKTF